MNRTFLMMIMLMTGCTAADVAGDGSDDAADNGTDDAAEAATTSPKWQPLVHQPTFNAGVSLLLTDGSVMVQDNGTESWWKLTPDIHGSYLNGTWKKLASLPAGYSPLYFASAVLPDGRVIVEGGEYINNKQVLGNQGAIYDPRTNRWKAVAPPAGWDTIGDAQSVVLTNGQFMLSNALTNQAALLDAATLTWTPTGKGKADINDEEGWTLLPQGTVLTVDANNTGDRMHSELYTPGTGSWKSAGSTKVQLEDLTAEGGGSHELGPMVLRPDGTVFAAGATKHTSIYDTAKGSWTPGPDFPLDASGKQLDVADGPAALLPSGKVLVGASPQVFKNGIHFFEFDGHQLKETVRPPHAAQGSSFALDLLLLPTGQVMLTDFTNDVEIYTPVGSPQNAWKPTIQWDASVKTLQRGHTYRLSGTQLNGLSQAVAYGDDAQAATNYPLVRIKNRSTGHVFYCRTHGHTSMSVKPGQHSSTNFDVPSNIELGQSDLVVVANGIASAPVTLTLAQ